ICHYLGVPLANYWRVKIPNCSVSYIEFGPSGPQVGLMGDISHLGTGFDSFVSKSL
ncbi:MAG: histidine phosphatase family protein, partial [Pyramidobacter sp.]|nr:histidine phosphatase family protein [Pyramidobacter sp.]